MSEERDDGGAAFPLHSDFLGHASGMSLRDWFAGQALRAQWGDKTATSPEDAASIAYQVADAMLAARANALPKEPT